MGFPLQAPRLFSPDVAIDEEALARRYEGMVQFSRAECVLFYEMLKVAGCSEMTDPVLYWLLRHMHNNERRRARGATRARRARREGGDR